MTGPTSTGIIERLTVAAERAGQRLERTWRQYERTPGASAVKLPALVRAYDALDRLRILLMGTRGGDMGLLAKLTEEIGPRIPRTEQGAQAFVAGVGRVIRHSKQERTVWNPDGLITAVAANLGARLGDDPMIVLADEETGEVAPPSEIARRATAATVQFMAGALGATPSKSWGVGALKSLGIDPNGYRQTTWGGFDIRLERGVVGGAPSDDNGGSDE